jgi:hypothetical protein
MMHSSTASIASASFRVLIGPLSPIIIFSLMRTDGTGLRTSLRTRRGGGPNGNWIGSHLFGVPYSIFSFFFFISQFPLGVHFDAWEQRLFWCDVSPKCEK